MAECQASGTGGSLQPNRKRASSRCQVDAAVAARRAEAVVPVSGMQRVAFVEVLHVRNVAQIELVVGFVATHGGGDVFGESRRSLAPWSASSVDRLDHRVQRRKIGIVNIGHAVLVGDECLALERKISMNARWRHAGLGSSLRP